LRILLMLRALFGPRSTSRRSLRALRVRGACSMALANHLPVEESLHRLDGCRAPSLTSPLHPRRPVGQPCQAGMTKPRPAGVAPRAHRTSWEATSPAPVRPTWFGAGRRLLICPNHTILVT
jgi:hypothetical protein